MLDSCYQGKSNTDLLTKITTPGVSVEQSDLRITNLLLKDGGHLLKNISYWNWPGRFGCYLRVAHSFLSWIFFFWIESDCYTELVRWSSLLGWFGLWGWNYLRSEYTSSEVGRVWASTVSSSRCGFSSRLLAKITAFHASGRVVTVTRVVSTLRIDWNQSDI